MQTMHQSRSLLHEATRNKSVILALVAIIVGIAISGGTENRDHSDIYLRLHVPVFCFTTVTAFHDQCFLILLIAIAA